MVMFAWPCGGLCSTDMPGHIPRQGFLGADTFELFQQPAVFIEQHCRRARDVRVFGRLAGVEHVDVGAQSVRLGNLPKDWPGPFAGGAVFIGEIQNDRAPGFQGFAVDRIQRGSCVCGVHRRVLFNERVGTLTLKEQGRRGLLSEITGGLRKHEKCCRDGDSRRETAGWGCLQAGAKALIPGLVQLSP